MHDKVFRAIVHAKTGETLHKTAGGLSYTKLRLRELYYLLRLPSWVGIPRGIFGMHRFRAGSATAAANADVPERMFMAAGDLSRPRMAM